MTRQRTTVFVGLLATAVAVMVTGVAARSSDGAQAGAPQLRVEPGDPGGRGRQVFRLGGDGQLGVMVSDGDDPARPGARIDAVDEGSAAAKAGARAGDVVVEFDGERVRGARQLTRLVQETPPGRAVKMTVLRDGGQQTLDVTPETADSGWNERLGPEIRAEIERGWGRLRDLPGGSPPGFAFRFDSRPMAGARGRLGVQVDALSDQLAGYFGAASGGVLVSSVTAGSPAEKAGLKAGDVLTAVNGAAVKDARELVDALAKVPDGAPVTLGIVRDKKTSTLEAVVVPAQPRPARRSARPTPRAVHGGRIPLI